MAKNNRQNAQMSADLENKPEVETEETVTTETPEVVNTEVEATPVDATEVTTTPETTESTETTENPSVVDSGDMPEALAQGEVTTTEAEKLGVDTVTSINETPKEETQVQTAQPQPKVVEPIVTEETKLPNALELQGKKKLSEVVDFDQLRSQVSALGQNVLFTIEEYMDDMMPGKPMTQEVGVKHQVKLFRALDILINKTSDEDFAKIYPAVLYLFHEHGDEKQGVFSMMYVYRFPEYIPLSTVERETFYRWLNMLVVTANPQTRKETVASLNWKHTLEVGVTEDATTRLQSFYGI